MRAKQAAGTFPLLFAQNCMSVSAMSDVSDALIFVFCEKADAKRAAAAGMAKK
jgi:hypothetical protein